MRALQNIVKTLSPKGRTALGLDVVCEWFMIDTVEEAAWFLQLHGLEVGGGEANAAVTLDAKAFSHPAEAVAPFCLVYLSLFYFWVNDADGDTGESWLNFGKLAYAMPSQLGETSV